MTRKRLWVTLAAASALGALSWQRPVFAHDPGLSSLGLTLGEGGRAASVQLIVNDADLPQRRRAHAGACDSAGVFAFALGGEALRASVLCTAEGAAQTRFEASLPLLGSGTLQVAVPLLAELPRVHRCFGRVLDATHAVRNERMLDRDAAQLHIVDGLAHVRLGSLILGLIRELAGRVAAQV